MDRDVHDWLRDLEDRVAKLEGKAEPQPDSFVIDDKPAEEVPTQ